MWYPSRQQQQQQYHWYGYARQCSPEQQQQQQNSYLRTSCYFNGDELSPIHIVPINSENDSYAHCRTTYSGNAHVITDGYVTTSANSYGDEMPSCHAAPSRSTYSNPVIAAPIKPMTATTSPLPAVSSSASSSACWNWLLFPPEYYSELYSPLPNYFPRAEEEKCDDNDFSFLASLPTCLLALLYLTPTLIHTSDDENDSDQEISSLQNLDEPLLASTSTANLNEPMGNISSNLSLLSDNKTKTAMLNIQNQNSVKDRSSTPDTDDGYQSASDVSRSDFSQQSSVHDDHRNSNEDLTIPKHSSLAPLMPRRITYAAVVKPTPTTKTPSSAMPHAKSKQNGNNTLSTVNNDSPNQKTQKSKFIAPRFERMHHAKQSTPSAISSNRVHTRSNHNNNTGPRIRASNSTRRR